MNPTLVISKTNWIADAALSMLDQYLLRELGDGYYKNNILPLSSEIREDKAFLIPGYPLTTIDHKYFDKFMRDRHPLQRRKRIIIDYLIWPIIRKIIKHILELKNECPHSKLQFYYMKPLYPYYTASKNDDKIFIDTVTASSFSELAYETRIRCAFDFIQEEKSK